MLIDCLILNRSINGGICIFQGIADNLYCNYYIRRVLDPSNRLDVSTLLLLCLAEKWIPLSVGR